MLLYGSIDLRFEKPATTFQALAGVTVERLFPAHVKVAERYHSIEGYGRANRKHRSGELGYRSVTAFERGEHPGPAKMFRIPVFLAPFKK